MSGAAAAVAFVGVVSVLNLALSFGVVRRLREHERVLAKLPMDLVGAGGALVGAIGSPIADFEAPILGGGTLTPAWFTGETLVGFFTPGCRPCTEQLPGFLEAARAVPAGPAGVVAVVVGEPSAATTAHGGSVIEELAQVATVVVQGRGGPMVSAFDVRGYPAFCTVGADGNVGARRLGAPERAAVLS